MINKRFFFYFFQTRAFFLTENLIALIMGKYHTNVPLKQSFFRPCRKNSFTGCLATINDVREMLPDMPTLTASAWESCIPLPEKKGAQKARLYTAAAEWPCSDSYKTRGNQLHIVHDNQPGTPGSQMYPGSCKDTLIIYTRTLHSIV